MSLKDFELLINIRLRQKGLFIFSILILGFLAFRYWALDQKSPIPEEASMAPGITIELAGTGFRPELFHYLRPPTVQQVIRDSGWLLAGQAYSVHDEEVGGLQDSTLLVETGKNGNPLVRQKPLSVKALWILGRPIPLNRATVEDLDRIPGIGRGLALRIVECRQLIGNYPALDQLKKVKGIKEKTLERIKKYLTL